MTTKKELQEITDDFDKILGDIKQSSALLEDLITDFRKAMPDERSGYYKPEIGDVYWLVDSDGDVISTIWRDITVYDIHRLSQGNVFRTREEAEHHKKKLDVIGKIRLAAMDDIAENGELDWGDDKIKYYLFYYHNGKHWSVSHAYMAHHHSTIYFKTKASAEQCLADIGNELDILIGEG